MLVLGIETSCDETSAAVVRDGREVLSNVIASQINLHLQTGGVVPEVAAREHVIKIIPVIEQALSEADIAMNEIDLIAVTQGPGLLSSLLIGTTAAAVLGHALKIPVVAVNHIAGHIYANWLSVEDEIKFPVLTLTVSGGHNELVLLREHFEFQVLGKTRDDAAGEAFDKVARMLGLGYPGGPQISKAAEKGDKTAFEFPRAWLENSYDFSFSGLKSAVWREYCHCEAVGRSNPVIKRASHGIASVAPLARNDRRMTDENDQLVADIAAGFQEAVVDVLVTKLLQGVEEFRPAEVHIAGGVSANRRLREVLLEKMPAGYIFRYPEKISYCTDNAAMIAGAGYFKRGRRAEDGGWRMIIPDLELVLG